MGAGGCTAQLGPGKGAARDKEEVARAVGDGADGDGGGEGEVDAEEVGEDRRDGGSREGGREGRGQEERGEEHCGDCWGWWKSKFGGVGGRGPGTWSTMGGAVGWDINPPWLNLNVTSDVVFCADRERPITSSVRLLEEQDDRPLSTY